MKLDSKHYKCSTCNEIKPVINSVMVRFDRRAKSEVSVCRRCAKKIGELTVREYLKLRDK